MFLDVADRARPFGLNLLDTGLGWDRDRAVANALSVFQREWGERFWGPRMEDAFRFALLSLFDANVALCAADPVGGRAAQHTLLEVPTILSDISFRRQALSTVTDPSVRAWWSDYFEPLDRRFQLELINPVLSKIHRFEGSTAARHIVGQPASTIDPAGWLRTGGIVIVNTARGIVGDNAAALIGSTLLNLVTLAVAEQARLEPGGRWPISMFVDEFHTIPGADYEAILAELNKYGANLVLATQSLARLLALGRDDGRGLRATVFANLDGLFAFNCSAEDATYLVPRAGRRHRRAGPGRAGRAPVLRAPVVWRAAAADVFGQARPAAANRSPSTAALAAASAARYGRDVALVEADRRSAVARVLQARAARAARPQQRKEPASRTRAISTARARSRGHRRSTRVREYLNGAKGRSPPKWGVMRRAWASRYSGQKCRTKAAWNPTKTIPRQAQETFQVAKVMVVDDAAFMRMRACKVLQENGHETVQAENGLEAVKQYAEHHPDAVLMDITMPRWTASPPSRKSARWTPTRVWQWSPPWASRPS